MTKTYTSEDVRAQIKPLSDNAFVAFFQKIWRDWLGWWYGFADKNPKIAKLLQQFVVMFLFSNLVTIFQALVMIFLPYAFQAIWDTPFVWPAVELPWLDAAGNPLNYAIFNEPVKFFVDASKFIGFEKDTVLLASTPEQVELYTTLGYELQMSGLGNFIAFEIATFLAQCINFPLQRNVTFKSKGNPVVQGIWYFIGWLGISIGVNAIWGIMNPIMMWWNWNEVVIALIKTFITGGVSMAIFFFIFLIIFPDLEKMAENAEKKVEALKAANAPAEQIAAAEAKAADLRAQANLDAARRNEISANTLANAKALSWEASEKLLETMKADSAKYTAEQVKAQEEAVEAKYQEALEATENKYAAIEAYAALKA